MLAKEGKPELKLDQVICVSARVRDLLVEAGLPVQHARIIHGGTDIERFLERSQTRLSIWTFEIALCWPVGPP